MNQEAEAAGEAEAASGEGLRPDELRLVKLFDRMEEGQLDFLDQAGTRIVEICSAMLGLAFAVVAFGNDFPPAYLDAIPAARGLALAAAVLFLLGLGAGLLAVQPRRYGRPSYNLTRMRKRLDSIVKYKLWAFRIASVLFGLGCVALAALVAVIILTPAVATP